MEEAIQQEDDDQDDLFGREDEEQTSTEITKGASPWDIAITTLQ